MKTLYKVLPSDRKPNGFLFKKNVWYKTKGKLEICKNGFHASENIIDAMMFIGFGWIAKVQVRGKSIIGKDKQCWEQMKIIEWHKWTKKDSVSLAIFATELVIGKYEYFRNKDPRRAIKVAKKVLKKDNKATRSVARSRLSVEFPVRSSSEAVTRSAWSVAESTAESALWAKWSAETATELALESAAEADADSAWWSAKLAMRSVAESVAWETVWLARVAVLRKCHNFVINKLNQTKKEKEN